MNTAEKIALAGVGATLLVGLMTAAFNGAFNKVVEHRFKLNDLDRPKDPTQQVAAPIPRTDGQGRVDSAPSPPMTDSVLPKRSAGTGTPSSGRGSISETTRMDYDALLARFGTVESSLRGRMQGIDPKPEILSALTTCQQDLAAAKAAIDAANSDSAVVRLDRARKTIIHLESL